MRVLIVEDDESLRRALSRALHRIEPAFTSNAADALRHLEERPVDGVLTDFGIVPMDGLTLLAHVATRFPRVRRWLMTGFDESRFVAHLRSRLIHRLFAKPLDIEAMRDELGAPAPTE